MRIYIISCNKKNFPWQNQNYDRRKLLPNIQMSAMLYASMNLQALCAYLQILSRETEFNAKGTVFSKDLNV